MLYLLVLLGLASGSMFVADTSDDEIYGTDEADDIDANAGDDTSYGADGADQIL
jgi:Ca2+-binding RTX toxin-like protein